jgi:glucosamine--fructose-6-phosphate aminotransferase (isomerizing)
MCGIIGYVGKKNAVSLVLEGLKLLEYRGYDSAGLAGLRGDQLQYCKEVGKVKALEKRVQEESLCLDLCIGHTRWATHGKPCWENAHPHFDSEESLALIHNGIIENYDSLRRQLQQEGIVFVSQTDTEVIAQLVALHYKGDLLRALKEAAGQLKGAFAIALIHKNHPGVIAAIASQMPLAIGIGEGEHFLSSDVNAFLSHTGRALFLQEGEMALLKADSLQLFSSRGEEIFKKCVLLEKSESDLSKGNFEHYMLKEIFEQPQAMRYAMMGRCIEESATAFFEELSQLDRSALHRVQRLVILGCGTSWHAGCIAAHMLEEYARIPTQVEISSEFRYKNPIILSDTLVLAISQSGETADTLAAVRELRAKGAFVIGICNVQGSTLSREVDATLLLRAGPEISVCSTKAFSSQLVVLSLFALMMARLRDLDRPQGSAFLQALLRLPQQVQEIIERKEEIRQLAHKYARYDHFFYVGRRYMYPMSLEGSLKLKEISYINANGYPAGELKHGPIALIDENCPTVAFAANQQTFEKMISNMMEIKARSGPLLAIGQKGMEELQSVADDLFLHPATIDALCPILSGVVAQLFAYYVALAKGCEIDQPRNLAKSVTVE